MVSALIEGIYPISDLQETPKWFSPLWTNIRPTSEFVPLARAGFKPYSGWVGEEATHFMLGPKTDDFLVRNQALVFQDIQLSGGIVTDASKRIIALPDTISPELAAFYAIRTDTEINSRLNLERTPRQARSQAEIHVLSLLGGFPDLKRRYLQTRIVDMCSIADYIYHLFEKHFYKEKFITSSEMKMLDILLQEYADEYAAYFRTQLRSMEDDRLPGDTLKRQPQSSNGSLYNGNNFDATQTQASAMGS